MIWNVNQKVADEFFAPYIEGCTMSNSPIDAAAADPPSRRASYEELLAQLNEATKNYSFHRSHAKARWQVAEKQAQEARTHDKQAAHFLRQCVELIRATSGVDTLNALRSLAALDQRSADAGGTFTVEAEESAAGPALDPDDRVALTELQGEEPGNGD